VTTENAKTTDGVTGRVRGWIYFDAACRFCVAGRRCWGRVFERRGYVWLPLQTPGAAARLGVTPERLMAEMWVLPADGRPLSGVGAWIELLRRVWWLWPLAFAMRLPGLNALAQRVYRWIAVRRYCFSGRCVTPEVRVAATYRHSAFFEMP
jgi:predicted DCC family thiol-disulfide oxidoreductase YuxK